MEWTLRDEATSRFLTENEFVLSTMPLSETLWREGATVSQRTVERRLKLLEAHGDVKQTPGQQGYSQITVNRRQHLPDKLDRSELEKHA